MKKLFLLLILSMCTLVCFSQNQIKMMRIYVPSEIDSIIVDSLKLDTLLKQHKIYVDFKNKNWSKINKIKLNECITQSKITQNKKLKPPPPPPIETQTMLLETTIEPPTAYPVVTVIENKGKLTYVISDTMKVNETYTVDLTLSTNMSNEQIINIIDGFKNKSLIDTMINITPIMRARLLDPSGKNFKITPITDDIQSTIGNNLVRWQWQVIPLTEGDNSLTISVDNYFNNKPQSVNIYNGKTYVYAIHTVLGDLWIWITTYWTYITYVIGLIGAIFGFIYKENIIKIFKKKE